MRLCASWTNRLWAMWHIIPFVPVHRSPRMILVSQRKTISSISGFGMDGRDGMPELMDVTPAQMHPLAGSVVRC